MQQRGSLSGGLLSPEFGELPCGEAAMLAQRALAIHTGMATPSATLSFFLSQRVSPARDTPQFLAERVRFELTSPVKDLRFSRPVHSTALPPLRLCKSIGYVTDM
jgi:hypothetical protein